jgi:hypothetical protein
MNTPIVAQPTEYQQRAQQTRRRRQAAGRYASTAQIAAFKRMMAVGNAGLTKDELTVLSHHPYLLPRQRDEYAALAAAA